MSTRGQKQVLTSQTLFNRDQGTINSPLGREIGNFNSPLSPKISKMID